MADVVWDERLGRRNVEMMIVRWNGDEQEETIITFLEFKIIRDFI